MFGRNPPLESVEGLLEKHKELRRTYKYYAIIKVMKKVLLVDPNNWDANYYLKDSQEKLEKMEAEKAEYDQKFASGERIPKINAYFQKMQILRKLGDMNGILTCYDTLHKLKPKDVGFYKSMMQYLEDNGSDEQLLGCYNRICATSSVDYVPYYKKIIFLNKLGRKEEAITCFENLISLQTKEVQKRFDKVKYFALIREEGKTLECFLYLYEVVIGTNIVKKEAYMPMLGFGKKFGGIDLIVWCYDQVLKVDPENKQMVYEKAQYLEDYGRDEEALKEYENLLAKEKDKLHFLWNSKIYQLMKKLGRDEQLEK